MFFDELLLLFGVFVHISAPDFPIFFDSFFRVSMYSCVPELSTIFELIFTKGSAFD